MNYILPCSLKAWPYFNFLIGLEQYISGVIMYEETLYQKTDEGTDFVALLKQKGIIPGIKVIVVYNIFGNCFLIFVIICL